MACAAFNPNLPHDTVIEEAVWLRQWNTNLLNSNCLQNSCGHACLPGNAFNSTGCTSCLKAASCNQTLDCINCVGINTNNFTDIYNCTVPPGMSIGIIIGIVLGCLLGVLLLVIIIFIILYKTNKLPIKTRLWIDSFGKHDQVRNPEDMKAIQDSVLELKSRPNKYNAPSTLDDVEYPQYSEYPEDTSTISPS